MLLHRGDGAMARPIKVVTAEKGVRAELEHRAKASTSAHRDRLRAKIILLRLEGLKNEDVAARVGTFVPTVSLWSSRRPQRQTASRP